MKQKKSSADIISARKEKVEALSKKLEEGVTQLFQSDNFVKYLDTISRFTNYSLNNTLLIFIQRPDATLVAGYKAWNKFGRYVKQGEKGITIFAPMNIKKEVDEIDEHGNAVLDAEGRHIKKEISFMRFTTATVFDVSQTEGEPLPSISVDELTGDVDGFSMLFDSLVNIAPVKVVFEDIKDGAKGYYSRTNQKIAIHKGMSELQNLKTLVHETAHSILHNELALKEHNKDRETKEVEAESIAYIVCNYFGIDTSEYSFGYVAGWSKKYSADTIRASLTAIVDTSHSIIRDMEAYIERCKRNAKTVAAGEGFDTMCDGKGEECYVKEESISS